MSLESATAFVEQMKTDTTFRESILTKPKGPDRLAAIEAAGYGFSPEDLHKARVEAGLGELSNEDLDHVAGGADGRDCGCMCVETRNAR